MMWNRRLLLALLGLALAGAAQAGGKAYQVTGTVVELAAGTITIKKGNENWTIARGTDTRMVGEPKPGDKVTVSYSMTASEIEDKTIAAPKVGKTTPAPLAGTVKPAAATLGGPVAMPPPKPMAPAAGMR